MMYIARRLGVFLLCLGPSQVSYAQLLQKGFTSVYEVSHNSIYLGDTVRTLTQQEDGHWKFGAKTEAKGFVRMFVTDTIVETSTLDILPNRIRPYLYEYDQSGGKDTSKYQLSFQWNRNKLDNTYLQQQLELPDDTQDLLSFVLQIMVALQADKKNIEMHIADKKRVDDYALKITGKEEIETPFKKMSSIVLLSNKIKDKMQFKIWCSPTLQYLPVKIMKIDDDGDKDVLVLKQLTFHN